eukprot:2171509-Prymnesium_polylepis.1
MVTGICTLMSTCGDEARPRVNGRRDGGFSGLLKPSAASQLDARQAARRARAAGGGRAADQRRRRAQSRQPGLASRG